jgi:tetratricopeptide (TPR) repeat protein
MAEQRTISLSFRTGVLLVLCLGAAVHAQSLGFDFSHLDDDRLILDRTAELSSLANAPQLFRQAYSPFQGESNYFRPLVGLSFMLDTRLPISPAPFHRTNVLLHLIACALFFTLVTRLGFSSVVAAVAASLFAVHPVAVSAVDWIPGRNDSLLACFFLASWLAFLSWRQSRAVAPLLWHLGFLLAALLTKETAVVMVPILWAFTWAENARSLKRDPVIFLGWGVVLATWWAWRNSVPLAPSPPNPDLFNVPKQILSLLMLSGKAPLPLDLSPLANPRDGLVWPGLVALVAVGAAIWWSANRRFALVAAGAFLLLLLPTLVSSTDLLLECRLYLPLCCLLLVLAEWLRSHPPRMTALIGGSAAAVVLLGTESVAYGRDYRSPLALGEACVRTAPDLAFSYMTAGLAWAGGGDSKRADGAFRKALELDPKHLLAHNDLAVLAIQRGELAVAERELLAEIAVNPRLDKAYLNLGIVRRSQGNYADAVVQLKRAVQLEPSSVKNMGELYVTYRRMGDQEHAAQWEAELARRGFEIHGDVVTMKRRQ